MSIGDGSPEVKGTVSLDNQPSCPRITIGSCGEVVVNYLISRAYYSKQIKLPIC